MVNPRSSARVVPWVSFMVYGIVLVAGLYYALGGLGDGPHRPIRTLGFVAGMAVLFGLELVERRYRVSRPVAGALLVARLGLFVVVVALDESSLSRVLFVLVPFAAYLTFGRTVSLVLGGLCLALLVAGHVIWVPGWYRDANYVSDILMFGIGLVMAIAMAGVAVSEQRYAARIAELSTAAERNRVARDIHDGLGHHLTAIAVQLEKASAFRDRDPAAAEQALSDARSSTRRALEDVRTSVGTLRAPRTLVAALTELVGQAGDDQLLVTLAIDGSEPDADPAAVTALYRAAQEAITNARRHGQARRVSVSVSFDGSGTRLVVADDGRGFSKPSNGFGLLGLRERAALVGGQVDVDSAPGAGTRITVTVPRRHDAILRA